MPTNGRASVQIATTQVVFTGTLRGRMSGTPDSGMTGPAIG